MNKRSDKLNKISSWISGVTCGVLTGTAGLYSAFPSCTGNACFSCPVNCLSYGAFL